MFKEFKDKEVFDYYKQNQFIFWPVMKNSKNPAEKLWTTNYYKDIKQVLKWIGDGSNVGIKTGSESNITVLDIDSNNKYGNIDSLLYGYSGFVEKTPRGFHYFFSYDKSISSKALMKDGISILNDKRHVVVSPSIINGLKYKVLSMGKITKMPKMLKKFLMDKVEQKKNENL